LDHLKKGPGESVSKYVARGENLCADLVATGFEMKKEELAFQLLVGLTSEYDMLVMALEARADVLTVEELLPLLLQTEARFKVQGETEREDGHAVAYAAKKGQPSKGFAQKRGNFEHKQKGSGSGIKARLPRLIKLPGRLRQRHKVLRTWIVSGLQHPRSMETRRRASMWVIESL
jgi:hypothetical protein